MRDVVFLAVAMMFFALATAYVMACARIVGPDEPASDAVEPEAAEDEVAA